MNAVESVVAELSKNLVIKTLDMEYGLITLASTTTDQIYSHYWTEQQNPVAEIKSWIQRFVFVRESFHRTISKISG
jgi:hypothetical protein